VLILYTYGGWNDAAFVAAEVKDGKKNITRSLVIGILIITLLYLLVNIAYIYSLGFNNAMGSGQIAADVLNKGFGKGGVTLMCVLVMVSALGAVNGLIFTGAASTPPSARTIPSWGGWVAGHARRARRCRLSSHRACLPGAGVPGWDHRWTRFHQLVARQNCHRQG